MTDRDYDTYSPSIQNELFDSAERGNLQVVKHLIKRGAKLDSR